MILILLLNIEMMMDQLVGGQHSYKGVQEHGEKRHCIPERSTNEDIFEFVERRRMGNAARPGKDGLEFSPIHGVVQELFS